MTVRRISIRIDTDLVDEALKLLGARSRVEAIHLALREIVGAKLFKNLMRKNAGKLWFAGADKHR
jgi:Arc/MetJ family transcription regulator